MNILKILKKFERFHKYNRQTVNPQKNTGQCLGILVDNYDGEKEKIISTIKKNNS